MTSYQDKNLVVDGVYQEFEDDKILENISLTINKGETVGIVGPSGVGKTTLFNIISGLVKPKTGHIYLNGEEITGISSKVSYMLQKDLLLPFRTVYQNISLPLEIRGDSKEVIRDKIEPHLEEFGLKGLENKYPSALSGGQKQRAALLRTYMFSDEVALLDEPFSALDYITKDGMYKWFRDLKERLGLTCLIITHDIDEAMLLSDTVYVMLGRPAHLVKGFSIPKNKEDILSDEMVKIKKEIYTAIKGGSN